MRFLCIAAILLGFSVLGGAQQNPYKVKPQANDSKAEPRSMPAVKSPTTAPVTSTSKELQSVERGMPKTIKNTQPKKARTAPSKASNGTNAPINFSAKGGGGGGGASNTNKGNSLNGRLKQKGQGHRN